MSDARKWGDLGPRVASGVLMAVLGALAVWIGGVFYVVLVAGVTGLLVWETARMTNPPARREAARLGALGVFVILLAWVAPGVMLLPILLVPAAVALGILAKNRATAAVYMGWVMLAGYGFIALRVQGGAVWMVWLVLVVVASDMAGYFVGKSLGGPKFWPRISPKKTWAGTIGGWASAALVGLGFVVFEGAGMHLIWVSVIVAFAAQMGDIAESTLKRRMGVKDSSLLIPGHGGVFDRFDGMVGAAALLIILMVFNMLHVTTF